MCGILGIWGGELGNLKHANDLQSHRGPDDKGLYIDHLSRIGLGHSRLSIIDTSALGHQPMKSKDEKVVLIVMDCLRADQFKAMKVQLFEHFLHSSNLLHSHQVMVLLFLLCLYL